MYISIYIHIYVCIYTYYICIYMGGFCCGYICVCGYVCVWISLVWQCSGLSCCYKCCHGNHSFVLCDLQLLCLVCVCSRNFLQKLPGEICSMNLHSIDVSNNRLTALPTEMGQLKNIQFLVSRAVCVPLLSILYFLSHQHTYIHSPILSLYHFYVSPPFLLIHFLDLIHHISSSSVSSVLALCISSSILVFFVIVCVSVFHFCILSLLSSSCLSLFLSSSPLSLSSLSYSYFLSPFPFPLLPLLFISLLPSLSSSPAPSSSPPPSFLPLHLIPPPLPSLLLPSYSFHPSPSLPLCLSRT